MITASRIAAYAASIVLLAGICGPAADAEEFGRAPVSDLYVFGDSLSDPGNLFALIGQPAAPYVDGRFSNGPVWVETLAPLLGLGNEVGSGPNNRAVGGALAGLGNVNGPLPGVADQVAAFEATGARFGRNDLVVIWAGANDYLFPPTATPNQVVGDLSDAVKRLAARGAKRFLLPSLPDLGQTPLALLSPDPNVSAGLSAVSAAHNARLDRVAARLADRRDLGILVLRVDTALDTLIGAGTVFQNVTLPCLGNAGPTGACGFNPIDGGANGGTLFWDAIHPTTNAHALLAFQAFGLISGARLADD